MAYTMLDIDASAASGTLSIVLRFPLRIRDSSTADGLLQQVQIGLSLIVENAERFSGVFDMHSTFFGASIQALHKILWGGYCQRCPIEQINSRSCSMCRVVPFQNFLYIDITGE